MHIVYQDNQKHNYEKYGKTNYKSFNEISPVKGFLLHILNLEFLVYKIELVS